MVLAALSSNFSVDYSLVGSGPVKVLFISGIGNTKEAWARAVKSFGSNDMYSILTFDNRGSGLTSSSVGRYTTRLFAEDTSALLDYIGWLDTVHVVGHSMGGMIAQELALLIPERIASLSLIATHAGHTLTPLKGISMFCRTPFLSTIERKVLNILGGNFSRTYLDAVDEASGEPNLALLTKEYIKRFEDHPLQPFSVFLSQAAATLTHNTLAKLPLLQDYAFPKMIITGTKDDLVDCGNSYAMQKLLKCKLVVFKGAGHCVHREHEKDVFSLLGAHFRRGELLAGTGLGEENEE
eukprot:GCRY01000597.1.p1 GENE.GCRY01000597.1~~GCRY01000597.1.p1  ORF type:complete len:295 (+),score=44.26 GCRY01000597.1:177-1061(+)